MKEAVQKEGSIIHDYKSFMNQQAESLNATVDYINDSDFLISSFSHSKAHIFVPFIKDDQLMQVALKGRKIVDPVQALIIPILERSTQQLIGSLEFYVSH